MLENLQTLNLMKQVSTKTDVLLLTAFAINVAFYLCLTNDLFVLSFIFLGALTLFGYLAVLSQMPKGESCFSLLFAVPYPLYIFFWYVLGRG
jgi:hypothetical protein